MAGRITAVEVNRQFVLTKCDYFAEVQIWPMHQKLDPERWLSNFAEDELEYAAHLLHAFLYYSNILVEQLFSAAFQRISMLLRQPGESFLTTQTAWRSFYDTVLITRVTGESPSETDSGFIFLRMARQVLRIPEERILSPQDALREILIGGPRSIVFVDDFVGSGHQFVTTWNRPLPISSAAVTSFSRVASTVRDLKFFYVPLLCTEYGRTNIALQCPEVVISPAHLLPSVYSALAPESIIWPPNLKASAADFLRKASSRAGIPDEQWKGFHSLALTVAFEHSVPDATLPLFYWDQNGWKPLVERK